MFKHSLQKFLTYYRKLEKKEAAAFRQFVKNMPGSGEAALELLDYIKKQPEGWAADAQVISGKLYGQGKNGGQDDDGARTKVHNALSDLNLQMPKFLLYRKAIDKSPESRWIWLAVLRDLGLSAEFSAEIRQLRAEIFDTPRQNDLDYWKCLSVDQWMLSYPGPAETKEYAGLLSQFNRELDLYYAVAKLKAACLWVNARNLQSVDRDLEHLVVPDGLMYHPNLDAHPLLLLYREVYLLITARQEEYYTRIIGLLDQHADAVDTAEMHLMVRYLYNYANMRVKNGDEDYWESINALFKFSHHRKILPRQGAFSSTHFINIVAAACNAHDLDWARSFMDKYGPSVPLADWDDTRLLSQATIFFEQKEFQRVLNDLEQKDFKYLFNNIRSRALILRSLYECDNQDERIVHYCASFERYLRKHREDIAQQPVDATLNTVRMVKKLAERKLTRDQLKTAIEETKPLYFKTWLLEKAARYPN